MKRFPQYPTYSISLLKNCAMLINNKYVINITNIIAFYNKYVTFAL